MKDYSKAIPLESSWRKASWVLLALAGPLILLVIGGWIKLSTLEMTLIALSGIFVIKYYVSWKPALRAHNLGKPTWLKNCVEGFWTLLTLFVIHVFLWEPMVVPTGSMLPTIALNDRILVEKYAYGIKLPFANTPLVAYGSPARGDIIAFEYPMEPNITYVKRVIAVGGDEVSYNFDTKKLILNGNEVTQTFDASLKRERPNGQTGVSQRYLESIGELTYTTERFPDLKGPPETGMEPLRECRYSDNVMTCKVPMNKLFVMGDNRDASYDSRFWGMVDKFAVYGRARYVFFNFSEPSRVFKQLR